MREKNNAEFLRVNKVKEKKDLYVDYVRGQKKGKKKKKKKRRKYFFLLISFATALLMFLTALITFTMAQNNVKDYEQNRAQKINQFDEFKKGLGSIIEEKSNEFNKTPYVDVAYDDLDVTFEFGFITKVDETINLYMSEFKGFDVGQYKLDESKSSKALILMLETSLNKFFTLFEYNPGSQYADIKIKGFADGTKVRDSAKYNGDSGLIKDLSYYSFDEGKLKTLTLEKGDKMINEYYALLRANEIKIHLEEIPILENSQIELATKTFKKKGKKYRKVMIEIVIKDALKKDYEQLNRLDRLLYENDWINLN